MKEDNFNRLEERAWQLTQKLEERGNKLPLVCRMCKAGLVKYICKVCPPLSANDVPMSEMEKRKVKKLCETVKRILEIAKIDKAEYENNFEGDKQ